MQARDPRIIEFLDSVHAALRARDIGGDANASLDRIWAALEQVGKPSSRGAHRRPAVEHLGTALDAVQDVPDLKRVADAFATLEPQLHWIARGPGGTNASANFEEGHANAMVVGPGGLEERHDMHIGVSLLAPRVRYPDHSHKPEETYLVLSPGRFQHGASGWFEPGVGGTLYNSPSLKHAMAADDAPLFAVWVLWSGKDPAH
jgi:hypothetical protein